MSKKNIEEAFIWVPGCGPTIRALERMEAAFPKPQKPMGEAWFMSPDRRMFTELVEQNVNQLDDSLMDRILFEIASGTNSFGPYEEWNDWWHYILPRLIACINNFNGHLIPKLINTSLCLDVGFAAEHNSGLRKDLLQSLGQLIMKPVFWSAQDAALDPAELGSWSEGPQCDGIISASIYFCLVLLDEKQIELWVESILAIEGRLWKANILAWLVASQTPHFYDPDRFDKPKLEPYPPTDWSDQFLLKNRNVKIEKNKIDKFIQTIRTRLDLKTFLDWVDDIYKDEELASWLKITDLVEFVADNVLTA